MMKKAIIYYFTGTGNTYKACELYRKAFKSFEIETYLYSITSNMSDIPSPNEYDYVGIAYPIHAFNAPYIVLDFVKRLPIVNEKKYFIIKTSGEPLKINNISSLKLNDILRRKGYELFYERHYVMPYNMIFRHTESMAYKMYEGLKTLVPYDVGNVIQFKERKLKRIPFGRVIAFLFRIEHKAMKINGKFFSVDKNKCVMCKACEKNCPVGNIHIDNEGTFKFDNRCIMCTKCSFNCPKDAFNIALLNNWRVNGKYNFADNNTDEIDKHKWYCKKAYERYFKEIEEIINK